MQIDHSPSRQNSDSALPLQDIDNDRILNDIGDLSRKPVYFAFLPWLILLISLIVTIWATIDSRNTIEGHAEDHFDRRTSAVTEQIVSRMNLYKQSLLGARGVFDMRGEVSRDQFGSYVGDLRLEKNYPGIQGLGYSLVIPPQKLEAHVQDMRKQGFPQYEVKPGGKRALYTSIIYLEPFDWRNQRAFGYDMYSEPTRRKAMEQARDTNKPVMSGKVILVQETKQDIQNGFLMYLPVYRKGAPHDTLSNRRENILGWVYEVFRMGQLFEGISGVANPDIDLHVYDGHNIDQAALMLDVEKVSKRQPRLKSIQHLTVAQHEWTLVFQSTPDMESQFDFMQPFKVATTGTLLSLLVFMLGWVLVNGAKRSATTALKLNEALIDSRKTLKMRSERLHALLRNASDGIHILDRDGHIIEVSDAFCRMLGYSRDEVIGMHVSQWDAQFTDPEKLSLILGNLFESNERSEFETKHRRKDGTVYDAEISAIPFEIMGRTLLFCSSRDISQRKVLEQSLLQERNFSNSILNLAGPIILVIDRNGSIVTFNKTAEELTGYRFEDVRDKPYFWKNFLLPKERSRVEEVFASAVAGKLPNQVENNWVGINGSSHLISWSNTRLTDEVGNFHSLIAIGIDITERRHAEDELKASELRLKEILNASPISVRIATQQGRKVTFCNRSYAQLIRSSNPIEEDPRKYYRHPEEYDRILDEISRGMHVINRQIELDINGDTVWTLASYMPLQYMNVPSVLGWFYDITVLKNSERELSIAATARIGYDRTILSATSRLFKGGFPPCSDRKLKLLTAPSAMAG